MEANEGADELAAGAVDEVSKIFNDAVGSFTATLPEAERKHFDEHRNAQSMISSIEAIASGHPIHRNRLAVVSRKFQLLADHLQPYFDVVEIFVQVKPEYMALIWGSMKMIFKLSSNYVSFLEKMGDMFQDISSLLPAYEKFVTILQERAASHDGSHPRLANALAFVYVDILRFCHSAYMLFANKKRSLRVKLSLIGRLLWRPFDVQYSGLVSRLQQHSKLFEVEVSLASTEEAMRLFARYEESIKNNERQLVGPGKQDYRQEERERLEEKSRLIERVKTLQEWLDPPRWTKRFEQAKYLRQPGTGEWILDNEIYHRWKKIDETSEASLGSRTLSKPGYGKTILCSTIIQDLGSFAIDADCKATHRGHSVVFYFFDKRRRDANMPAHAIRAMLAQLLHLHREDEQAIDVVSFLFTRHATGEFIATNNEVFAVLEMLLDHLKFTYLVFDGLDECSDPQGLFKQLEEVASRSKTSAVLLLGRPSVQIPSRLSKDCFRLDLESEQPQHGADMRRFLKPQLEDLQDEDLFPEELNVDDAIREITGKANGMFLWVRLLVEYLRLPSLTTHDRVDAIRNLTRLQGLDSLYKAILDGLAFQFPGKALRNVCRLFQLVAYSRRALDLTELQHAISMPFDRRQTRRDLIPNFARSLGSLSGSLIELSSDGRTQFIHLSAQEYFTGASAEEGQAAATCKLLTSRSLAHRNIAASCLSYIIHTVPADPLGGSTQVVPNAAFVQLKYPLLKYSVESWNDHLADAFKVSHGRAETITGGDASWDLLSELLNTFLTRKRTITMWIEAAWLYGKPPDVPHLPDPNALQALLDGSATALELFLSMQLRLNEFRRDLGNLRRSWSYILKKEPNEIWEPSIPAFTKSSFWLSSTKAQVVRVAVSESKSKYIIVRSQLSKDGTQMGVVKLLPTLSWMLHGKSRNDIGDSDFEDLVHDADSGHWRVRYELWLLSSNTVIEAVEITLPSDIMETFVIYPGQEDQSRLTRKEPNERSEPVVSLPLDISEDLRRIVVLHTLIAILQTAPQTGTQNSMPGAFPCDEDHLDGGEDPSSQSTISYQVLNLTDTEPTTSIRQEIIHFSKEFEVFENFYHIKFSPTGEYFAVIHESVWWAEKNGVRYGVLWLLQIFRDENHGADTPGPPRYAPLTATRLFAVPEVSLLSPVRGIAFHPTAARLAFPQVLDGLPQTYIWDFEAPVVLNDDDQVNQHLNPFPVHEPPIIDPAFSDTGTYLYGTSARIEFGPGPISVANLERFGRPLIVKLPPGVKARPKFAEDGKGKGVSRIQTNPDQRLVNFQAAALELAGRTKLPVQRANVLAFDTAAGGAAGGAAGVAHISQLQNLEAEGAVVFNTLGTDGRLKTETLSRLPRDAALCVDVSIVHGAANEGKTRIVLDRAARREYARGDVGNATLPAIVERERDSIPTFVTTVSLGRGLAGMGSRGAALPGTSGLDAGEASRLWIDADSVD
ncbi:hypothetical protein QBC33DRAFT_585007 [Phialemonium atrogriseum]|uniref:NACHT domain-containing protein n=1 Tax=Phialemonium atrogriseum TaxID=1093897 RepID=A0AAJ0FHU5_9PEZI|nr:uncharacterized protein QBC33DRAFT_585007 [Phialemonium atrogriseum]KAK1768102.1 hypothetical protein QBC33DRAFT_585007 [Phialemonium atrogriseum]